MKAGAGKTTTGKAILQLLDQIDGEITYKGQVISHSDRKFIKEFRRKAQMIFQDPYESLNSKFLVIDIVAEPLEINGLIESQEHEKRKSERSAGISLNLLDPISIDTRMNYQAEQAQTPSPPH